MPEEHHKIHQETSQIKVTLKTSDLPPCYRCVMHPLENFWILPLLLFILLLLLMIALEPWPSKTWGSRNSFFEYYSTGLRVLNHLILTEFLITLLLLNNESNPLPKAIRFYMNGQKLLVELLVNRMCRSFCFT